jgi:hypothetical protein
VIVRIDHLTLSSPDVSRERRVLESLGYRERFFARGVRNLRIKEPLVTRLQETHDLLLLDAPGSVSIEVINQADGERRCSPIVPVFQNPSVPFEAVGSPKTFGSVGVRDARFEGLDLPVYVDARADPAVGFTCATFVTRVSDLVANVRLWEALGCRHAETPSAGQAHLVLSSAIDGSTLHFYFVNDESCPTAYALDSYGFNYWALLSTSPANDRNALARLGFTVTPLEESTINGRALSFFFATGAGIVPVEILGRTS